MIVRTRFTVTTCLYRNPNNRASSLSTPIAVSVAKDTPEHIVVVTYAKYLATRQSFQFSFIADSNKVMAAG